MHTLLTTFFAERRWLIIGIKSVLPTNARYTENPAPKAQHIGVTNNLQFAIYVLVLSSIERDAVSRCTMNPGKTDFWHRQGHEVVLVSTGGASGAPQALLGRVGFTLHIDRL
jgi:hypothetical protein